MSKGICALFFAISCAAAPASDEALWISVYATAGAVNRYLATPRERDQAVAVLQRFKVSRVFVEGRRGDEYVPPEVLRSVRDDLQRRGFRVSGGIATVWGKTFGVKSDTGRYWLNFQAEQTQRDLARFFTENAAVFDELIVDDFYCTADKSPESEKARANRPWSDYRRDLLVSLIGSVMRRPANAARPSVRLIVKYPQWYDRFHQFGYDPPRMSAAFDQTWVGTETRNPHTERYGFVQPYEGYVNYRWLASVAGKEKMGGAWFDHGDCTARNFVDQAYQSVLAGAPELTLFSLYDLMRGHEGHALLEAALPELFDVAEKVRSRPARGIAFYKPPASDGEGNLYLADYAGMLALPVVPAASYPGDARVALLAAQAAADPRLVERMNDHLRTGATLIVTPALLRRLAGPGAALAGVRVPMHMQAAAANQVEIAGQSLALERPVEIEDGLDSPPGQVRISAPVSGRRIPLLTSRKAGRGRVLMWNVRTFSGTDGEPDWLLAPRQLGLPEIPQALADALRQEFLAALDIRLSCPAKVAFYLLGDARILYNFRDEPVTVRLDGQGFQLGANRLMWR